jgi:hypothetical protein
MAPGSIEVFAEFICDRQRLQQLETCRVTKRCAGETLKRLPANTENSLKATSSSCIAYLEMTETIRKEPRARVSLLRVKTLYRFSR